MRTGLDKARTRLRCGGKGEIIEERSEPSGSLRRVAELRRPFPSPVHSFHCCFTPFLCFFPHEEAWSQARLDIVLAQVPKTLYTWMMERITITITITTKAKTGSINKQMKNFKQRALEKAPKLSTRLQKNEKNRRKFGEHFNLEVKKRRTECYFIRAS